MEQGRFTKPITSGVMRMLGIATVAFALCMLPTASRAQAGAPAGTPVGAPATQAQRMPANLKKRPMTADELRKAQTESRRKAKGTPKSVVRHSALGMMKIRMKPELFTVLEQQKAFVASRGVNMARTRTLTQPMLQNQPKVGVGTLMNSTNPSPSGPVQPTTGAQMNSAGTTGKNTRMLAAPAPLKTMTAICRSPVISDVNGQATKAVFTPQPEYNSYVIKGCFFGTNTGQAYLVGKFNALKVNLQPTYWVDDEIDARVDPNIAGELDQDNVSLVIAPVNGQQIKGNGFKFYAVRSDPAVLLTSIPQSWVWLSIVGGNILDHVQQPNVDIEYSSPVISDDPPDAQGWSAYVGRGNDNGKFDPLADYYSFYMAPGWSTDSFQLLPFDRPPGCGGVVTYKQTFGTWDPEWDVGDAIRVNWADTSCSGFVPQPPVFPLFVTTYSNVTGSAYALKVWARGPRCTDLYSGKLQQQCVQNVRNCGNETCGH